MIFGLISVEGSDQMRNGVKNNLWKYDVLCTLNTIINIMRCKNNASSLRFHLLISESILTHILLLYNCALRQSEEKSLNSAGICKLGLQALKSVGIFKSAFLQYFSSLVKTVT